MHMILVFEGGNWEKKLCKQLQSSFLFPGCKDVLWLQNAKMLWLKKSTLEWKKTTTFFSNIVMVHYFINHGLIQSHFFNKSKTCLTKYITKKPSVHIQMDHLSFIKLSSIVVWSILFYYFSRSISYFRYGICLLQREEKCNLVGRKNLGNP